MKQGPHWQPTPRQKSVGLAVVVVVLFITYAYSAEWTGFSDKTLWDWLQLLVIPAVIAAGGVWFNRQQREREMEAVNQQRERELAIENQRAQDEALQAYIEGMERLLLEQSLRDLPEGSEARVVGRARTLTVLPRLDSSRKASVLRFLYEAGLISNETDETKETPVVELDKADLSEANLNRANLMGAFLGGTNLSGALLSGAILSGANLFEANLSRANLSLAAGITSEELERQVYSLEGATMPNGQKYEEWLEEREGRGEDGG